MTNGDHEGWIFLPNNIYLPLNNAFFILKKKGFQKFLNTLKFDIRQCRQLIATMTSLIFQRDVCLIFIFPTSWYGVCEIELFHMGKTAEIPIWCTLMRKPHYIPILL